MEGERRRSPRADKALTYRRDKHVWGGETFAKGWPKKKQLRTQWNRKRLGRSLAHELTLPDEEREAMAPAAPRMRKSVRNPHYGSFPVGLSLGYREALRCTHTRALRRTEDGQPDADAIASWLTQVTHTRRPEFFKDLAASIASELGWRIARLPPADPTQRLGHPDSAGILKEFVETHPAWQAALTEWLALVARCSSPERSY